MLIFCQMYSYAEAFQFCEVPLVCCMIPCISGTLVVSNQTLTCLDFFSVPRLGGQCSKVNMLNHPFLFRRASPSLIDTSAYVALARNPSTIWAVASISWD